LVGAFGCLRERILATLLEEADFRRLVEPSLDDEDDADDVEDIEDRRVEASLDDEEDEISLSL